MILMNPSPSLSSFINLAVADDNDDQQFCKATDINLYLELQLYQQNTSNRQCIKECLKVQY